MLGNRLSEDGYLLSVVKKNQIRPELRSKALLIRRQLDPILREWGGIYLKNIIVSGSYAKGTAIKGSTDVDLFLSLAYDMPLTKENVFHDLHAFLQNKGLDAQAQNVSIGLSYEGYHIDLIPATRRSILTNEHTLYHRNTGTWIKTNIRKHIRMVKESRRQSEIIALKVWREKHQLEFPSFYLELSVLKALRGKFYFRLVERFYHILYYLRDDFRKTQIQDPSNSNNVISDDLSSKEKDAISNTASSCLNRSLREVI